MAMNEHYWKEFTRVMPLNRSDDTRGIVAVDDATGEFLGGVVCDTWTTTMCCCHIAVTSPKAFRQGLHTETARYVFTDAGRIKVIAMVSAENEKSLKLTRHLGFEETHRIKDGYDFGIDYVVMELNREDCPYWLGEEDGSVQTRCAAAA